MKTSLYTLLTLAVVVFGLLALAGCTQSAPASPNPSPTSTPTNPAYSGAVAPNLPAEPGQSPPVVPANPNNSGAAPSAPAPSSSSTCSITLDKLQIVAGQSADLHVHAFSGYNEKVTYLCGSDTKTLGTNGLFDELDLCQFNTPGNVSVWVAINGQPCASANLQVLPVNSSAGLSSCFIVPGTRSYNMTDGLRTYQANVSYANYSASSVLSWDCAWKSYQQTLGPASFGGNGPVSGIVTVNCQYTFDPGVLTTLPVHVNNDLCGDILK